MEKKKASGIYGPIISIVINVLLIVLVAITLFGKDIIDLLPDSVQVNFSSFAGYLPMSDEGDPNGVIGYALANGKIFEPQAFLLGLVLVLGVVCTILSTVSLFVRRRLGRRFVSLLLLVAALGAIGMFIFTYGLNLNGELWADINSFFSSVFTIGMMGSLGADAFGAFAVFTTYILITGFGVMSFLASNINK
ncbi:MAG: hypothetical protein LBT20_08245 [Clostridiales bacterium]|jgi:hypothetical protein|nr:hypothetical protein [Clostridiales bacterium]